MARPGKAIGLFITLIVLAVLAGFLYFKFFWVFSDGTKTGELNSLTYTGYLFKTYEGEMILTGYGSKNAAGTVQSKTFKFSVSDKAVAEKLTQMTGLRVTVHYKEYKGALPWRGYEKSIVDRVEEEPVTNSTQSSTEDPFFL
jgi:flagellar basal body-associated protein FliL